MPTSNLTFYLCDMPLQLAEWLCIFEIFHLQMWETVYETDKNFRVNTKHLVFLK
jgi:hypothetical protein